MTQNEEMFCLIDMAFRTWAENHRWRTMSSEQAYRALWRMAARGAVVIRLDDQDESYFDLQFVPAWRLLQRRRIAEELRPLVAIYHARENRGRPGRMMAG